MPAVASPRRVVVIGAGVAGLTAARRLAMEGTEVLVLEARNRVGGRVWSHRLPNDEIVELGGEWISTSQTRLIDLVAELGLGLVDTGMDFTSRDPVGGPVIPDDEHERVGRALVGRMEELGSERLAEITVADLLAGLGQPGPAGAVLRSRLAGTAGAQLDRVSAGEIGEEFGVGDQGSYVRVDGGNDRLAKALAAGLELRLETVVVSVQQRGNEVGVITGNEELEAAAVVLAVPLPVLRRLVFDPALPEDVALALDHVEMGKGIKMAVPTSEEPPMFRRQDTDIPAWYWTGLGPQGSVRRAVTGFAGTEPGVDAFLVDPMARLARAAPEVDLGAPIVADWVSDPFAGGSYSVIGPGQRGLLEPLARPWGRVFLAGEHVNGSGTIVGAVESGEDAATRLLATVF
ncbi:MAG TPA: NAD(P)/FAD-dependent oxidoreductase [Acidimicrobiia bacterium]|nr:NAD(P)/FAD-dependent oxidoreductase [Acidimicrobiia bacterium]